MAATCACKCNYCLCNCNNCTCYCDNCTCNCNNCTCNAQGASTGTKKSIYGDSASDVRSKTSFPTLTAGTSKVLASLVTSMKTALQAELKIRGLPEPGSTCTCNCNYTLCACDCNYNMCACNCNNTGDSCSCNCNYCTCNCNYCTCNCNNCTCNCQHCTCNCNYSCTCDCAYSDERLKDIISETYEYSVEEFNTIKSKVWKYKFDDKETIHFGPIAQDIEKVFPFVINEDSNGYKMLDNISMIGVLWETLNKCIDKIDELEQTISKLKGK